MVVLGGMFYTGSIDMGYVSISLAANRPSNCNVIGFAFAFGVFEEYYSTHEPFAGSHNIAVIGTCAMVRVPEMF
jgi:hypothetical protein